MLIMKTIKLSPALPSQPPEISGQGSNYAYGDNLDLNCTGEVILNVFFNMVLYESTAIFFVI